LTNADDFDYERVVMDACARLGINYDLRSPGTLLVARSEVEKVLRDVMDAAYDVLGLEGFEVEGRVIHPRLDLIYDRDRTTDTALDALARFDKGVWVDIVLAPASDIQRR
jgi:hypothetical protein